LHRLHAALISSRLRQRQTGTFACASFCLFSRRGFRETSVVDRPNPEFWGRLYDDVMNQAERRGDVIVLHCRANDGSAYFAANHTLIADHSVAVAVSRRGHHELCLQVALAAETANDLMVLAHRRKRRRRDGRLARFGGHSSGGHLCGVALVTDWQKDFDLPANGDST
jgi:hypothetical protein